MKNFISLLLFFSLILCMIRCEKNALINYRIINGRLDEVRISSHRPENVNIVLIAREFKDGSYTGYQYDVDSTRSDANGRFSFLFEDREGFYFTPIVRDKNYFDDAGTSVYGGWDLDVHLTVRPKCWVRFHIKNVNPYDEHDIISAPTGPPSPTWDWTYEKFFGADVDTIKIVEQSANMTRIVEWSQTKGGKKENKLLGVAHLTRLDTIDVEIFY